MFDDPVVIAGLGGVLWAFGFLARRFGVEGATDATRVSFAVASTLQYSFGTFAFGAINFILLGPALRAETFSDEAWRSRTMIVAGCGMLSGLGGMAGAYAMSLASHNCSALISMLESSSYLVISALMLVIAFGEHLDMCQSASAALFVVAVLMIEGTKGQSSSEEKDLEVAAPASDSETRPLLRGEIDTNAKEGAFVDKVTAAVLLAVFAGFLWAFGSIGKSYGVAGVPEDLKFAYSTCTYMVYLTANFTPLILVGASKYMAKATDNPQDSHLLRGVCVFCGGLVSGAGGAFITYAYAVTAENEKALISMVGNGVLTVLETFLVAYFFGERFTTWQWISAALIMIAVLLADMSKLLEEG